MKELLEASVWGGNLIPTILLIFVLVYWLTVIIGLVDLDALDFDLDLDGDADGLSVGWLNHVLYFFNLGQVPLMLFLSFLAMPMWFLAIATTDLLNLNSTALSYLLLLPNFAVSLFIAKIFTQPFVKLFSKLDAQQEDNVQIIGKICTILLDTSDGRLGQARIDNNGSVVVLNVKTKKGTSLTKGETGLVIDYVQEKGLYIIEPFENLDNISDVSLGA